MAAYAAKDGGAWGQAKERSSAEELQKVLATEALSHNGYQAFLEACFPCFPGPRFPGAININASLRSRIFGIGSLVFISKLRHFLPALFSVYIMAYIVRDISAYSSVEYCVHLPLISYLFTFSVGDNG